MLYFPRRATLLLKYLPPVVVLQAAATTTDAIYAQPTETKPHDLLNGAPDPTGVVHCSIPTGLEVIFEPSLR